LQLANQSIHIPRNQALLVSESALRERMSQ
jgi:hypothetical protein